VGDAGVLLGPGDDLPVVAELLRLAVAEPSLRATLQPRGEARLEHYTAALVAERMRTTLLALAAR
jgi:hypothetical protein